MAVFCKTIEEFTQALPITGSLAGLDHGTRRIGFAVSDLTRRVAVPVTTLQARKFTTMAKKLLPLLEEYTICGLIAGDPRSQHGKIGPRAQSVRSFLYDLQRLKNLDLPILLWDERYSSQALSHTGTTRGTDHHAACYILQGALDRMRQHKTLARTPSDTPI